MKDRERKRAVLALAAAVGLGIALSTPTVHAQSPPQALVYADLGPHEDLIADLEALGWAVTTSEYLQEDLDDQALLAYDAVWLPARAGHGIVRDLVGPGGAVAAYTKQGGVLVLVDVQTELAALDVAPGGPDVWGTPDGGSAPIVIDAPDHPLISGAGTGGSTLTAANLDPEGSGGAGHLTDAPEGAVVLASNAGGPVLVEYGHGEGTVIVSLLSGEDGLCRDNLIRYVESLTY